MHIGLIMGCGPMTFGNAKTKEEKAHARLFRILVSESAFLIWKIHNERVVQGVTDAPKDQITNRWRAAIRKRIEIDARLTSHKKCKGNAIPYWLFHETWGMVVQHDRRQKPAHIWWRVPEFLVSIWLPRARNRPRYHEPHTPEDGVRNCIFSGKLSLGVRTSAYNLSRAGESLLSI